jgi:hypothetical protein
MIAHGLSHWVCLFVVGFACLVFVNASSFPSLSSEALESLSENRFSTPCGISPTVIMKKKEEKGIRKKDKSKDRLSRAGGCCNDVDANELDALGVIPWNYADFVGWKHSLAENS